jgi:hypothetical protein
MTDIEGEGLFLIEDDHVTHIHTTAGSTNLDALREYLKQWDLLKFLTNNE